MDDLITVSISSIAKDVSVSILSVFVSVCSWVIRAAKVAAMTIDDERGKT